MSRSNMHGSDMRAANMAVTEPMGCVHCGQDREFEQPPCADEHGGDCPELACVVCGYAIVAGSVPHVVAAKPARLARTA